MHFKHSFTVPNEKNACIRPQRGVYMHLHGTAFLFRDTFIIIYYIEKVQYLQRCVPCNSYGHIQ